MISINTLNRPNYSVLTEGEAKTIAAANAHDDVDGAEYKAERKDHGFVVNVYLDGEFVLTL